MNATKLERDFTSATTEAQAMIEAEIRGGNVVKENWWRGKLAGLRMAKSMMDSLDVERENQND